VRLQQIARSGSAWSMALYGVRRADDSRGRPAG
jgi:hypothetical protein